MGAATQAGISDDICYAIVLEIFHGNKHTTSKGSIIGKEAARD